MSKEKKPFNETGLGKFIAKATPFLGDVVGVVTKVATGNIGGALEDITGALKEKAKDNAEAQALLLEFERERMQWILELERIDAADRSSARSREVELAKTGKKEWIPAVLAMIAVCAFAFALVVVAFFTIPTANREMFTHILGIVEGAMLVNVYSYYFGSSSGSRRKTEMMESK